MIEGITSLCVVVTGIATIVGIGFMFYYGIKFFKLRKRLKRRL